LFKIIDKSGNCGECIWPYREEWRLTGENGIGAEILGKYLLSVKNICFIEQIPELIKAGINSFKVEGWLRDPGYLEVVSHCYMEAIDALREGNYHLKKVEVWKLERSSV
jgi:putative protease